MLFKEVFIPAAVSFHSRRVISIKTLSTLDAWNHCDRRTMQSHLSETQREWKLVLEQKECFHSIAVWMTKTQQTDLSQNLLRLRNISIPIPMRTQSDSYFKRWFLCSLIFLTLSISYFSWLGWFRDLLSTSKLMQKCYWNNTKSSSSISATRESVEIFITAEVFE